MPKLYCKFIKFVWYGYNDRGNRPIEKESDWLPEEQAEYLKKNLPQVYEHATELVKYVEAEKGS